MHKLAVAALGLTLLTTSSAHAAEVSVQGRIYTHSCGYFSNMSGDFALTFKDATLPWGSAVTLVYGWGGSTWTYSGSTPTLVYLEWERRAEVMARATAPYTWTADVSGTVAERSSPVHFEALQFAFRVRLPDGREYFEKGGDSPLGFFEARWPYASSTSTCVSPGEPLPQMQPLPLTSVGKF